MTRNSSASRKCKAGWKEVQAARAEALVSISESLGIKGHNLEAIRSQINARVYKNLNENEIYDEKHTCNGNNKHTSCTIMSCNMRSIKNKLTSINGIDLWSYCKSKHVQGFCIQDHQLREHEAPRIQAAARAVIPNMYNSTISIQQAPTTKIGGAALLCGGALSRYKSAEIKDQRGWGRYSGRIIQGKKHATDTKNRHHPADRKHQKKTNLAIISLYAAVEGTEPGSMWQTQKRLIMQLPSSERQERTTSAGDLSGPMPDPHKQLRYDLSNHLKKLEKKYKCNFIIMGDFNINLHKNEREQKSILSWGENNGLQNMYMDQWGSNPADQLAAVTSPSKKHKLVHTWYKTEKKNKAPHSHLQTPEPKTIQRSHVDHTWVSSDLIARKGVLKYAIATHQIANTDHRPMLLTIDLKRTLGIDNTVYPTVPQPRRITHYKNELQRHKYGEEFHNSLNSTDIRQSVNLAYADLENIKQSDMDSLMQKLTACIHDADKKVDTKPKNAGNRKFKQGYSKYLIDRVRATRECKGMLSLAKQHDKSDVIRKCKLAMLKYSTILNLPSCPHRYATYKAWALWEEHVREAIKELRKHLHHKKVQAARIKSSEHNDRIEKARLISSESGIFYRYITNSQYSPPATELLVEGEWVDTPEGIKRTEETNLYKHMYGRKLTFHSEGAHENPLCEPTHKGLNIRQQISEGTSDEWRKFVPPEAQEFFAHARCIATDEQKQEYGGIFDEEIPFELFDKFCSGKAKNRAPGESGIRIDHVCSAKETDRRLICKILSLTYLTKNTFRAWDVELINWIPKEVGNPAMDRRRPIALLEVLRKITLGVKKDQVFRIWDKHNYIDKDNFAFMPGKFISDPILLKRLLLEDAIWLQKTVITLDVDYKAAFDKVPYFIKEMALRRLGMPEEGIQLWCAHDQTRMQKVRTAYGLTEGVHPRCGAFGQGAEESPMGFVSLMSWKCDYIFADKTNIDPYQLQGRDKNVDLSKTIFCDDSSYTTSTLKAAQYILDRIGFFAAASGMELNIKKTFYVNMYLKEQSRALSIPMPEFDKHRYEQTGEYRYLQPIRNSQIKQEDANHPWRHLGNFQTNKCSAKPLVKELKNIISNDLSYMTSKRLTSDAALMGYERKILMQMLYKLKHGNLKKTQIVQLQQNINAKLKKGMKVHKNIPDGIYYGHAIAGGLGVPHLWDETNIEKTVILQASLQDKTLDIYHTIICAIRRQQEWCCITSTPLRAKLHGLLTLNQADWLSTVWRWLTENDIQIGVPSLNKKPEFENDKCIMELYLQYMVSVLTEDGKNSLENYEQGRNDILTEEVRAACKKVAKLREHLVKHQIIWLSDISTPRRTKRSTRTHTNRALRRQFHHKYTHSRNCAWVKDLLAGVPGILTATLECDFNIGERNLVANQPDELIETEAYEHFQNNAGWYELANLEYTEEALQTIREEHAENDEPVVCSTDGSVWKGKGTFSYLLYSMHTLESNAYGGGKEDYDYSDLVEQCLSDIQTYKISSTRMEALAILGLHVAVRYLDPDHLLEFINLCDSEAAINTYRKLPHLNRMQMPKLPNSDVWLMIREYQKKWGKIHLEHVPSHMDDEIIKAGGTLDMLTPEWKANIMADKLADEYYCDEQESIELDKLSAYFPGYIYQGGNPVVVPFGRWAREYVSMRKMKTYFITHHPAALEGIEIDWTNMRKMAKSNRHLWQRMRYMRIIWQLYAFQHIKFTRGHCDASDIQCVRCKNAVETQHHVLHECKDSEVRTIKKRLFTRISELLCEHIPDHLSKWVSKNIEHIWGGDISKINYEGSTALDYTQDINLSEINKCAWNGMIPSQLTELVRQLLSSSEHWKSRNGHTANKIVGQINGLASSAICEIWETRKDLLRNVPTPKTKNQDCIEQARLLAQQGLLPGPGGKGHMSFEDFKQLHPRWQQAKMNKILRRFNNIDITQGRITYLPYIGQKVRSYQLQFGNTCTKQEGVITQYTGDVQAPYRITEKEEPHKQCQASLAQISRRLEMQDGLTEEERSIKNERITAIGDTEKQTDIEQLEQERKYQPNGAIPAECETLAEYHGAVSAVSRTTTATVVSTIYEDGDTEDKTFEDFLTSVAFRHGRDHPQRVRNLLRGRSPTRTSDPTNDKWDQRRDLRYNWRVRQHAPTRRKQDDRSRTAARKTRRIGEGGTLQKDWGWGHLGIFSPLMGAPPVRRQGGQAPGGGPGLPTGFAGDYG